MAKLYVVGLGPGDYDDMTISQKQHLHSHEKQLLGKFAAGMIRNGETVILDSGTTTMEIAKNLENFNELTVITTALDIAIHGAAVTVLVARLETRRTPTVAQEASTA